MPAVKVVKYTQRKQPIRTDRFMNQYKEKRRSLHTAKHRLMILSILFCVFFMQCISAVRAEETAGEEDISYHEETILPNQLIGFDEGFSTILYDKSNGLPTSEANDIVQSEEGFLWIGSYAGLVRYDGNTFERLDSSTGITSVKCLHTDTKGRLWIGTNEGGIFMMEKGELKSWTTADGLCSSSVRAMTEDDEGRIFIGTTAGLNIIDSDLNLTKVVDPRIENAFIPDLSFGEDGKVYGSTNSGDGFVIEGTEISVFLSHEDSRYGLITYLYPDPISPGYIYFENTNGNMMHVDYNDFDHTAQPIDTGSLSQTMSMAFVNQRLWFCCRNGIGVMDRGKVYTLKNVPMNNSATKVISDYEGNLWFTSTRQGVMKIVPNQFSDIFEKFGLESAVVNTTCMLDDQLFIGTDAGLLAVDKDGKKVESVHVDEAVFANGMVFSDSPNLDLITMLSNVRIRSIMRDSKDRLWIAAWRQYGVLCYDHGKVTIFSDSDGLYSNNVRRIIESPDQSSYIVAVTGGINIIRDNAVADGYDETDGITNLEILCVENGKDGDILCGSDGGGIFILRDGETLHIDEEDGLTSGSVMRIKHDEIHDIYWIVTGNSLAWLTSDYQELHTISKFPYSNNFDLYKNKDDMMWILSSNGIYVASAESLLSGGAVNSLHYGIANGLPCIATANSYSELTDDGELYIAGSTGVAKVNINTPYVNISNLKASVPYIEADGERIYPDEDGGFTIDASVRKLTIYPYVFNYSLIDPQVTYSLKGFDNGFTTVNRSDLVPVDYTNLAGGNYSFIIQMVDQMGGGNKVMSVRITKAKRITEQLWFYLISASVLLTGAILIFHQYVRDVVRRIEKKHRAEAERERIKNELNTAHNIQQSLLPHEFPPYPERDEFDIYALMDPAREVGGDFYNYFLIDDDHLCLVIADVSGKGIPAALFMMMSKIIVQSYANTSLSPAEILTRANETICENNPIEMFVTVWLGILEISTGKLKAANAGHEYPYLMKNGKFSILKDKHGLVLGSIDGIRYKEYEIQMEPGDRVFVYTDGVPEATDSSMKMFELDRLAETLNKDPGASAEQILVNVITAINNFVKDSEQFDDITMLCLEYHGNRKD